MGFTDSFNFEKKMYSDSSIFNAFGFGGPKIKRIRIRRDIDISKNGTAEMGRKDHAFTFCLTIRKGYGFGGFPVNSGHAMGKRGGME